MMFANFISGGSRRGARPRRIVAADYDKHRLWLALADVSGSRPRFRKLVTAEAPEALDLTNPAVVGAWIGAVTHEHGMAGVPLVMAAPRSRIILRHLALPPGTPDHEVAGIVRFQIDMDLPFTPGEAVVDYTLDDKLLPPIAAVNALPATAAKSDKPAAGERQTRTPGALVAVCRKEVIGFYTTLAEAAGATLHRLTLRSSANAQVLGACLGGEADGPAVMVHLAADEAGVEFVEGRRLLFSRSVQTPLNTVKNYGLDALVEQVVRHVQSYRADEYARPLRKLYVSGDTGIEADLIAALARQPRLVERGVERIEAEQALRLKTTDRGFATVLGLAMVQTAPELDVFDLLNPKQPSPVRDYRRLKVAAAVAAATLLAGTVIAVPVTHQNAKKQELSILTQRVNKLTEENRAVVALQRRVRALDAWVDADREWLDHWAVLNSLLPPAHEAYITGLTTRPDGAIAFTLRAIRPDVFTDLAQTLSEAGYDFRPGPVSTVSDRQGYSFAADVRLQTPARLAVALAELPAPAPRPADDGSADRVVRTSATQGGVRPPAATTAPNQPQQSETPARDPNRFSRFRSQQGGEPR